MTVFIEVETDPFQDQLANEAARTASGDQILPAVRRPLRGIEVSEPTYSYIKVIDRYGTNLFLTDTSSPDGMSQVGVSNYLLQALSVTRAEKSQIVLTFGETFVFFFGEQPIQATVQGALIKSNDFTWDQEFWRNYNEVIRGTRLADYGARIYLYVDGMLLEGLAMSANGQYAADNPHLVPFNLQMLITNIQYVEVLSADYPRRRQAVSTYDLTSMDAWQQLGIQNEQERQAFLEERYGVEGALKNKAAFQRQQALSRTEQAVGYFQRATESPLSPLMFVGFDWSAPDAYPKLDPSSPPVTRTDPLMQRTKPLRSKTVDNVDEYLRLPPTPSTPDTTRDAQGSTGLPEAAEAAGVHPPEEPPAGMDVPDPEAPVTSEEAATTLQEAGGAQPGDDVNHMSGVVPGSYEDYAGPALTTVA